jgi:hypothetical protein
VKSYFALSPADLAEHYVAAKGDPEFLPDTAAALVADVRRYLQVHGLDHRQEEALEIAEEALQLAREALVQAPPAQQLPTPEAEAAFRANVEGGTTADDLALRYADELALAGQIQHMSMAEFSANRERLGMTRDLGAFLLGSNL